MQSKPDRPNPSLCGFIICTTKNHTKISFGVVECIGFSDFIYELNKPIKFVKMDIEGAQVEALTSLIDSGACEMIHKIAVEIHDQQILSLKEPTVALKEKIDVREY